MKISIIVPCYNEIFTIREILEKINISKKYNKEIIVIDDGSTDGSRDLLEKDLNKYINHLILNEKNYGKGYSICKGINLATGDIILIQDADLEYDPQDYPKLIEPIIQGYADVVYGSRFLGSQEKRVLYYWHSLGNYILTTLSNIFTNLNLTDMENCYKVFRSDVIKKIQTRLNAKLKIGCVFLTQYDPRKVLNRDIAESVQNYFGEKLLNSKISSNVALAEAPSQGKDIFSYNKTCRGANDYDELCDELIKLRIF
jgi:glycosyltransferase involved in cell wall biosynthesis